MDPRQQQQLQINPGPSPRGAPVPIQNLGPPPQGMFPGGGPQQQMGGQMPPGGPMPPRQPPTMPPQGPMPQNGLMPQNGQMPQGMPPPPMGAPPPSQPQAGVTDVAFAIIQAIVEGKGLRDSTGREVTNFSFLPEDVRGAIKYVVTEAANRFAAPTPQPLGMR